MRFKRPKLPPIFRWQYVVPRLAVIAVVVLAVRFGLDPAIRWAIIFAGESAIGAKVEVADVTTSLRGGEVTITGIAAANPGKPMRNLLESSQVRLHVDGTQLLRKRVVVHDGRIEGLKFDSERTVSGALSLRRSILCSQPLKRLRRDGSTISRDAWNKTCSARSPRRKLWKN